MYGLPVELCVDNLNCSSLFLFAVISPVYVSLALLRKNAVLSIPSSVVASTLVSPLPLPVNVLVPMLTLPNPLLILPASSAPVPTKLL